MKIPIIIQDMTYYAQQYYNRGYNVLVVDLRGYGQSQGDYTCCISGSLWNKIQ